MLELTEICTHQSVEEEIAVKWAYTTVNTLLMFPKAVAFLLYSQVTRAADRVGDTYNSLNLPCRLEDTYKPQYKRYHPSSMRSKAMQCSSAGSKPLLVIYLYIRRLYRQCDFYIRSRYCNRTVTLLQQSGKYLVIVIVKNQCGIGYKISYMVCIWQTAC